MNDGSILILDHEALVLDAKVPDIQHLFLLVDDSLLLDEILLDLFQFSSKSVDVFGDTADFTLTILLILTESLRDCRPESEMTL